MGKNLVGLGALLLVTVLGLSDVLAEQGVAKASGAKEPQERPAGSPELAWKCAAEVAISKDEILNYLDHQVSRARNLPLFGMLGRCFVVRS